MRRSRSNQVDAGRFVQPLMASPAPRETAASPARTGDRPVVGTRLFFTDGFNREERGHADYWMVVLVLCTKLPP